MWHLKRLSPTILTPQSYDSNTFYIDRDTEEIKVGYGTSNVGNHERILLDTLNSPFVNVRTTPFLATGDGTTDDTEAIQDAIDSLTDGGVVYLPNGTYNVTSQITIPNGVQLVGQSQHSTVIYFTPTGAATCLKGVTTSAITYSGSIRELRLYAVDTTYTKVGIELVDVDNWLIDRVIISGATSSGGTAYWGGNGSIGIRTKGRNNCTFRSLSVNADKPLVIAENPNSSVDIDHFHFQDLILVGNGNPIVTIDTGVNLSHVTFDGYQAWVKGTSGLYWVDTTTAQVGNNLTLRNVRHEQGTSTTAYVLQIEHNSGLQGLNIDGLYGGLDMKGVKLRKVNWATIQNYEYLDTAKEALNIDSTVDPCVLINSWAQTGSTISASGVVKQFEIAANAGASIVGNSAIPMFAVYGAGSGARNLGPSTPDYADNAAAVAGGLAVGAIYRTGDALKIVHA